MDKYINYKQAIRRLDDTLWDNPYVSSIALQIVKDELYDFPAADVAPVIHGKWHDVYMTSPSSFAATCSICGISNDIPHPISAHYCPNCGAKMDGE